MSAALFALIATDWVSGACVLPTVWRRLRLAVHRRRAPASDTPLADEVEAWLQRLG